MIFPKLALASAIIGLLVSPAAAEDPEWYRLGESSGGSVMYARTADLLAGRSHHTAARMWIMFDARKDRAVAWSELKALYVVNCVAQTYRMVSYVAYRRNGSVMDSDNEVGELDYVIPGSMMSEAVDALCSDPSSEDYDT